VTNWRDDNHWTCWTFLQKIPTVVTVHKTDWLYYNFNFIAYISRSTKMIPHQPVAKDVTLAVSSAEDWLQSDSADFRSPPHLDAMVPLSPYPGSRTRPQPAIHHYDAVSTFQDKAATCNPPLRCCVDLSRR